MPPSSGRPPGNDPVLVTVLRSTLHRSPFFLLVPLLACADGAPIAYPSLELVEEVRIDRANADLLPVDALAVSRENEVFISQNAVNAIRAFAPAGGEIAWIDGEATPSGSFGDIGRMGFKGDSLWAYDDRLRRILLFTPALTVDYTIRLPTQIRLPIPAGGAPMDFHAIRPLAMTPEGRIHGLLGSPDPRGREYDFDVRNYASVDPAGEGHRLVARVAVGGRTAVMQSTGRRIAMSFPFAPEPIYEASIDGRYSVLVEVTRERRRSGAFGVTLFGTSGDTIYSREYPYRPLAVPRGVRDSVIAAVAGPWERVDPDLFAAYRRRSGDYRTYPPVEDVVVGRDGSVWLRLVPREEGTPYLVIDPSGEPLGEIVVPARLRLEVADYPHAWGLLADDDELDSIVRVRIATEPPLGYDIN